MVLKDSTIIEIQVIGKTYYNTHHTNNSKETVLFLSVCGFPKECATAAVM